MRRRPLILTIFGWFLILAGAAGFVFHFPAHRPPFHSDDFLPDLLELILMAAGIFILRGRAWARWLALAWIAFHVGISYFNSLREVAVHTLILLVFAWILFHPAAREWFRGQSRTPPPDPA
ncbi:MAG TPA: hypothetical protein VHZ09_00600 [Acidobacteriaceae bacterium]|jgi:uncharacterized membrane protein HdeD (DUF308 family)|nr:hypothetical protein [Acidobacteriaceae bacterium]